MEPLPTEPKAVLLHVIHRLTQIETHLKEVDHLLRTQLVKLGLITEEEAADFTAATHRRVRRAIDTSQLALAEHRLLAHLPTPDQPPAN